jgi:hypothetical protein
MRQTNDAAADGGNAHASGLATTAARDLAAYDALPPRLRALLRRMPDNVAAEAVLQAFIDDSGDENELAALLERRATPP